MKTTAMYSPYGWKARIGLIVPSTNTVNEPEFWRVAPDGVTIHTARALLLGPATEESYFKMAEAVNGAAEELATAEVDVVAYGCTSGSIICPLPELIKNMSDRVGKPAIATAGAVVAALRALGVTRIAVGTPYVDFVNESEKKFLEDYGFQVTSMQGLDLGHTQEERRGIGRVPPEVVYRLARAIDRPDAEAIFISCTNLATFDVIAEIEQELGKPVVTSNQSCIWACLRLLGIRTAIAGYGRLLQECLEPIDASSYAMAPKLVRAA
ncbi:MULTISPECIES: aspartate/glutamate racemase family protein [Ramlibacter]|uniref:Decarboxylase n=1 Tax=Ramlibacter pinisoli TaxID=2682844 RepID=A0A6N8IRE4_9BURK|nr:MULTISPECIES: aspartate/glutamate racemase family protein [Ramlibacter]MBA2964452.1 aspartate/glutamate racemase family protein [Ramlibacter sp. CGMCC 1.13660]MVQ29418.1 decarboxylase [Ramlibacter pinisoli]